MFSLIPCPQRCPCNLCITVSPEASFQGPSLARNANWRLARMSASDVQAPSLGRRSKCRGSPILHAQRALVHLPPLDFVAPGDWGNLRCEIEDMEVKALFPLIYASHVRKLLWIQMWTIELRQFLHWSHFVTCCWAAPPALPIRSHTSSSDFKC